MAVVVEIFVALRRFVDNKKFIECRSGRVIGMLKKISNRYPRFEKKIFNERGKLKSYIDLLIDGQNIRELQDIDTLAQDGQKITILLGVAGG